MRYEVKILNRSAGCAEPLMGARQAPPFLRAFDAQAKINLGAAYGDTVTDAVTVGLWMLATWGVAVRSGAPFSRFLLWRCWMRW